MHKLFFPFVVTIAACLILEPIAFSQAYPDNDRFRNLRQEEVSSQSFRDIRESPSQIAEQGSIAETLAKGAMIKSSSGLFYQVHVLGEIKGAGTYRISASDRLSEVLMKVGGVRENGSIRNIELRREGKKKMIVDLLLFKVFGDLKNNPFLLDNDVVYVPLKDKSVRVVGAVKRPDEYELKSEKSLEDVIHLAGGLSIGVAPALPIRVIRFVDGKKSVIEIRQNKESISDFQVKNGDVIFAPHIITAKNTFDFDIPKLPGDNIFYPSFEDRVFILGGVTNPGAYSFNPYYKLSQYLSLAGGTTKLATKKIYLINPDGDKRRLRKKSWDKIVINPGDTVLVDERRIPPEGWVNLFMSIAGFGLSATATILTLTNN